MSPRVSDDAILDAVVATVIARGYNGATTRQIAAAARVNEVTLFRRFANKQTLVLAAIHRDMQRLNDPGLHPTGDLEADLLAVLAYYTQLYHEQGALPLIVILEAIRNPELANLLTEPIAAQARLRELITHYQHLGQLRDEPPQHAVNALIGPLLAYGIDTQLGTAAAGPPNHAHLLDRFLHGHRPPSNASE